MARLRDSYGGMSGADLGPCHLGLLAEMRTRQASGVVSRRGSLAVCQSPPNVLRWTDACEMLASVLTSLANYRGAVVNFGGLCTGPLYSASSCDAVARPLTLRALAAAGQIPRSST